MNEKELELKEAYLDKYVFYGLQNLNNGFDAPGIKYFSEEDFEVVLQRVKDIGLGIYGIEPWKDGQFYDVITVGKLGDEKCKDPNWYMTAFEKFKKRKEVLQYAASYYIPEKLLKK
jgi:hypothetical protein